MDVVRRMQVYRRKPLIKIYSPDGEIWRVFLDGTSDGFPEGMLVISHADELIYEIVGQVVEARLKEGSG